MALHTRIIYAPNHYGSYSVVPPGRCVGMHHKPRSAARATAVAQAGAAVSPRHACPADELAVAAVSDSRLAAVPRPGHGAIHKRRPCTCLHNVRMHAHMRAMSRGPKQLRHGPICHSRHILQGARREQEGRLAYATQARLQLVREDKTPKNARCRPHPVLTLTGH